MTWEHIRIILALLFFLGIFGMLAVLIPLANCKKKFLLYAEQIKKNGKIDRKLSLSQTQLDFFIAAYIFSDIPSENQRPDIYEIEEMNELKAAIGNLTRIAKPLASGFGILVIVLIVLLNIFEK
jgi:hypothetical protein